MFSKHSKYVTDSYFRVFDWMPFQDRLRTSILEVMAGFGVHDGTIRTSMWGPAGNLFGNVCGIEFLLDLWWMLGGGPRRGATQAGGLHPQACI